MGNLPSRIALVYDRVNKWGGAERVLLALHKLFPRAPLYTSVYDPGNAPWAKVFPRVIPSFLNRIPFARNHHELIPFLTPLAFESFDFSQYEAVISVTSADAQGIVTRPGTFHFCYCLTPTRYLWSHYKDYYNHIPGLLKPFSLSWFKYLKSWDIISSARPDVYAAISQTVQERIKKYYGRESDLIYPPVNTGYFSNTSGEKPPGIPDKYFLYVGRFVSYKNPELVISVFNELKIPLVVVGKGSVNWGNPLLILKTKTRAGPNITLFDWVSDSQMAYLFNHCQALVYFHEEDFGIVPVEAMACGKPVIGINRGGVSETVINGRTGLLADSDTEEALISLVRNFDPSKFDSALIKKHAARFSQKRFSRRFVKVFEGVWTKYKNTYMS